MKIQKISQTIPTMSQVIDETKTPNNKDVYSSEAVQHLITQAILEADKAKYPIGKIEINVSGVNPYDYLGFGTWELWGAGRVPVGVDTAQTEFNVVEKTGGEKEHKLTQAESGIREHTHALPLSKSAGVSDMSDVPVRGVYDSTVDAFFRTGRATAISNNPQDYKADFIADVSSKDAVSSHNNLQPYITCYMWKRIS